MWGIEDNLPLEVKRALLKSARRLIAVEAELVAAKKGKTTERGMFEKCPNCGEMSGEIQAPNELAGIEAARLGTLSAHCARCNHHWVLPTEIQAAWVAVLERS